MIAYHKPFENAKKIRPFRKKFTIPAADEKRVLTENVNCTFARDMLQPEFATYEMRNPKPGKGLGCFMA